MSRNALPQKSVAWHPIDKWFLYRWDNSTIHSKGSWKVLERITEQVMFSWCLVGIIIKQSLIWTTWKLQLELLSNIHRSLHWTAEVKFCLEFLFCPNCSCRRFCLSRTQWRIYSLPQAMQEGFLRVNFLPICVHLPQSSPDFIFGSEERKI